MITRQRYDLILSIYLSTRGLAYVLAEGATNPLDWGTSEVNGPEKNTKCLASIKGLMRRHRPDIVVLEDVRSRFSFRGSRIRELHADICEYLTDYGVPICAISRDQMNETFRSLGAGSKDEIAEVIGERVPVLALYVPPVRKAWMAAHSRMALFDAMAFLIAASARNFEV